MRNRRGPRPHCLVVHGCPPGKAKGIFFPLFGIYCFAAAEIGQRLFIFAELAMHLAAINTGDNRQYDRYINATTFPDLQLSWETQVNYGKSCY